jgi:hypothetical protein
MAPVEFRAPAHRRLRFVFAVSVALVLLAAGGEGARAAGVDHSKVWPKVGAWRTALIDDGTLRFCGSNYLSATDADGRSFGVTFSGNDGQTLSLGDFGPARSRPARLQLILDGALVGDLPVVNVQDIGHMVSYDVDLADLAKAGGFPAALTRGKSLVILGGPAAYTLPLDDFAAAHAQMSACLGEKVRRDAGQSAARTLEAVVVPLPGPVSELDSLGELDPLTVNVAAVDLALLGKTRGLLAMIDYSETCFAELEIVSSSDTADRCIAFDEAALIYNKQMNFKLPVEPADYFSPAAVQIRIAHALNRIGGAGETKSVHLKKLRDIVPGAVQLALEAVYPDERQHYTALPKRLKTEPTTP